MVNSPVGDQICDPKSQAEHTVELAGTLLFATCNRISITPRHEQSGLIGSRNNSIGITIDIAEFDFIYQKYYSHSCNFITKKTIDSH